MALTLEELERKEAGRAVGNPSCETTQTELFSVSQGSLYSPATRAGRLTKWQFVIARVPCAVADVRSV